VVVFVPQYCEKPNNLSGYATANGAVIHWSKPENIDGVLLGYNVFRGESKINEEIIAEQEYHDVGIAYGTYIYKVSALYEHCESDQTDGFTIIVNGIHDFQTDSFIIYPNPASNELHVTSYTLHVTDIEVFDVYGRTQNVKFPSNKLEGWQPKADGVVIDISNLPAGVYFVKIYTKENQITIKKLIINNS